MPETRTIHKHGIYMYVHTTGSHTNRYNFSTGGALGRRGRLRLQNVSNFFKNTLKLKHSGKSVSATEELKEIFNEYFTNIGPNLAQTFEHDSACNFEDYIVKRVSVNQFSFQALNELMVTPLQINYLTQNGRS